MLWKEKEENEYMSDYYHTNALGRNSSPVSFFLDLFSSSWASPGFFFGKELDWSGYDKSGERKEKKEGGVKEEGIKRVFAFGRKLLAAVCRSSFLLSSFPSFFFFLWKYVTGRD